MDREPLRVLCVDDNHDTADSEAMLLEIHGCAVEASYDGASALAATLRFSPDVCLIDYNMPDMDGCEVGQRLRACRRVSHRDNRARVRRRPGENSGSRI